MAGEGQSIVQDLLSSRQVGARAVEAPPQMEPAMPEADLWTFVKVGMVDDPDTMVRIFAKARGLDPKNYKVLEKPGGGNTIAYVDSKGVLREETPETGLAALNKFLGFWTTRTPEIAAGAALTAAGHPILGLGAEATIAGMRKGAAQKFLGEPGGAPEVGMEALITGGAGAAGLGVGTGIAKGYGLGKAALSGAGQLARRLGPDIYTFKPKEMAESMARAREFGIDLFPGQASGSRRLLDRTQTLQRQPATADIVNEALERQGEQVQTAIHREAGRMGKEYPSRTALAKELSEAAGSYETKVWEEAKRTGGPFYEKAFREQPQVDISPVIEKLDAAIDIAGRTEEARVLKQVRATLMKSEATPEGVVQVPEERFITLHKAKMNIDKIIDKYQRRTLTSIDKDTKRIVTETKQELMKIFKQNSDYEKGWKIYDKLIPEVTGNVKGIIKEVATLQGDKVEQAIPKLFKNASPDVISKARRLVRPENPDAWDAGVRATLEDRFNEVTTRMSGLTNWAGQWINKVAGDQRKRFALKAMMSPEQWERFQAFEKVMRDVSRQSFQESTTTPQALSAMEMQSELEPIYQKLGRIELTRPFKVLTDWLGGAVVTQKKKALANLLVNDTEAARQLLKLKTMNPRTQNYIQGLAVLFAMVESENLQERP